MKICSTLLLMLITNCCALYAQEASCKSITLGEFLRSVKSINPEKQSGSAAHKKFSGFSFKEFKPIEGQINSDDFFEVGFDTKNEIIEIIHTQNVGKHVRHKMTVYDFTEFRIMVYQFKTDDNNYSYLPIAFVLMKSKVGNVPKNFMINTMPLFGDVNKIYRAGNSYKEYPMPDKLEEISAIMALNDELYPTSLLKINNCRIVFDSDINYKGGSHEVENEWASVFLSDSSQSLKISENMCLEEIFLHKQTPDMAFSIHPAVGEVSKKLPLWIFGGAHDYK